MSWSKRCYYKGLLELNRKRLLEAKTEEEKKEFEENIARNKTLLRKEESNDYRRPETPVEEFRRTHHYNPIYDIWFPNE